MNRIGVTAMLLLPVLTGIILTLPGIDSSVYRGPNERYETGKLDSRTFLERLLERYNALNEVEEKRRLGEKRKQELDEILDDYSNTNQDDVYINNEAKNLEYTSIEDPGAAEVDFAAKELEETEDPPQNNNKKENDHKNGKKNSTTDIAHNPLPPQAHKAESRETRTGILQNDFVFIFIVAACSIAGLVGLIMAGVCWYKLHRHVKAASDVDYPAYGVTGPTKERSPSQGDRKLAQSAQMYHYQHQKQQMIALEKANGEMKPDASEDESEEENEEGDYTVYECPGLAPTGEMEVRNPLFTEDAQTPVNGQSTVVNGVPEEKKQ